MSKVQKLKTAPAGHNSAGEILQAIVERIERLMEERSGFTHDINDVLAEAKGNGFDTKTIREMVKLRKLDKDELAEREHLRAAYAKAIGLDLV